MSLAPKILFLLAGFCIPLPQGARSLEERDVESLLCMCSGTDDALRAGAEDELVRRGADAVPFLVETLGGSRQASAQEPGEELRRMAAQTLARLGPPGVRALANMLERGPDALRTLAAGALAFAGRDAQAAAPDLAKAMGNPDPEVRRAVANGIARIGPDAGAAARSVARALEDGDRSVRLAAAWALASIGPDSEVAAERIYFLQRDSDPILRGRSAVALARMGRLEDVLVEALVQGLLDPEADVRAMTAETLRHLGLHHPDLIPRLTAALQDPDAVVQWEASAALASL